MPVASAEPRVCPVPVDRTVLRIVGDRTVGGNQIGSRHGRVHLVAQPIQNVCRGHFEVGWCTGDRCPDGVRGERGATYQRWGKRTESGTVQGERVEAIGVDPVSRDQMIPVVNKICEQVDEYTDNAKHTSAFFVLLFWLEVMPRARDTKLKPYIVQSKPQMVKFKIVGQKLPKNT